MQRVSPLLVFNDKQMEAAATAELQRHYSRNDCQFYTLGAVLLVLMASKMRRSCGWDCALPTLCEAVLFAALQRLFQHRRRLYLRHRSLILGACQAGHQFLVIMWVTGCLYGPANPSQLGFWVQELSLSLVPWIMLVAIAHPVPLKHAIWHQAAILAVMLACLPQQHQLSMARMAAAGQHYMSAAQALLTAASALLPPGPSGWCARDLPRLLGPPGAFYLVHSALLLLGALATLVVHFWFEVPRRVVFACENGMASAVDALMRRRSQWRRLGIPQCVWLVAAGWVAGCFATLPLKAVGLLGEAWAPVVHG